MRRFVALVVVLALAPCGLARAAEARRVLLRGTVRVGALDRTYVFFAPPKVAARPALVLAFHGSGGDGEKMRYSTGYELEALAERDGFVVVYPDGFRGNWNDCRKKASYPARSQNIDDEGFVRALIARFVAEQHVDARRVFAVGYSNGAQLAYRLALELPDRIAGIAAVAAGLPAPDNSVCRESGRSVPTLIINGTDDPLNPFGGGDVSFHGFGDRGDVRSTAETAAYFARLAGQGAPQTMRLPRVEAADPTSVTRTRWATPGHAEVVLDAVEGGGHLIPQGQTPMPVRLGRMTRALDGPAEIWGFFSRQPPRAE